MKRLWIALCVLVGAAVFGGCVYGLGYMLSSDVRWQVEQDARICDMALGYAGTRRDTLDVIVKLKECR